MGFLILCVGMYLICGFGMCWQIKLPIWWAPIAPALAIGGLFIFVPRDLWLRLTGRGQQADEEWTKSFLEDWIRD